MAKRERFRDKERRWFDTLVCTGCHAIWKNINEWCFSNPHRHHTVEMLARIILEEFIALKVVRRVEVLELRRDLHGHQRRMKDWLVFCILVFGNMNYYVSKSTNIIFSQCR